jgi:hypothetical protein
MTYVCMCVVTVFLMKDMIVRAAVFFMSGICLNVQRPKKDSLKPPDEGGNIPPSHSPSLPLSASLPKDAV